MKRLLTCAATLLAAAVMAFSIASPANAIVDENGNVVAIILGPNGEIYY